jgi:hypothetical protein
MANFLIVFGLGNVIINELTLLPFMVKLNKREVRNQFQRALANLQQRSGWNAKELAAHYGLPHRSLLHWLSGRVCPGPRRLRELCVVLGWDHDLMFRGPRLGNLSDDRPLDFRILSQRFLSVRSREPLEAFNYCSLAGALVFNDLSVAGFECRAIVSSDFRTHIRFLLPKLAYVSLRIDGEDARGLVVSLLDEHQLIRETMVLSQTSMNLIKKNLRSVARG